MKYIQSEDYLCFATLLEMVFNDIGVQKYTRFDIAEDLGITLPLRAKGFLKRAHYSDDEFEWGIKVSSESLNAYLKKNGINLWAQYIRVTPYTMLEDEVRKWNQSYVIFLFSYGELIGDSKFEEVGHAALFINMFDSSKICIYDPGPDASGKKNIDCYCLENAMYKRRAGYILLHKVETSAKSIVKEK